MWTPFSPLRRLASLGSPLDLVRGGSGDELFSETSGAVVESLRVCASKSSRLFHISCCMT